jgi:hypothetical protein
VADITVEVSSPGLIAYGSNSWGSFNYGGFDQIDVTVSSVDAFNTDGWGAYQWGYLVWGQNFEDASAQVTTPGTPTTWGQNVYGNYSWGQITGTESEIGNESIEAGASVILSTNLLSIVNGTVSAQANFIIGVNGVESNSTVNSVFAGENVIVEVTTPGSPTTWGFGAWSTGAWNQIAGVLIQQGDESIEGTGIVNLTGVQASTTTASLVGTAIPTTWGFQTWGSNSWQQTNNFVIGDANVTPLTNIISVAVNSISSTIDADVEVTSPGNLPWGSGAWNYGTWGNIGGMLVSQGAEEEAVPSIEVFVSTNLLTLTLTSIAQVTGDANLTLNTNLLTTSLGNEDAVPNTFVSVSTNLLNVSVGAASGEVLSTVSVTGVNMTASTGRLFIAAWAVVDIGVTNTWSVVDIAA